MSGNNKSIKLETECRKCIKPSSPTAPHLESFKLSLLDQLSPDIHGNMTFFFLNDPPISQSQFSHKSLLLQNSLSRTLTLFYPLAGTLRDASTIHCNDHGAIFIQSRTPTTLSDILAAPDFHTTQHLLPTTSETSQTMLVVRFTLFGCGSTAITISLSHKIADFAALITFLKAWTAACSGGGGDIEQVVPELTIGAALFPPREIPGMSASVNITTTEKFTTRRLVFEASKIEELKNRVKTEIQNRNRKEDSEDERVVFEPSRVEVVLALIWRCALLASKAKTASFNPSILFQAVNLRGRMVPAVPESAVGNMVWAFAVTVEEESEVELEVMVKKMRDAMREFVERKVERFKEEGGLGVVMEDLKERGEVLRKKKKKKDNIMVYKCSSWCKFGLSDVDFGWGKPVWMCAVNNMVSNTIALMDTVDGNGIEAFVTLDDTHMSFFYHLHDLLRYALLNPTPIPIPIPT